MPFIKGHVKVGGRTKGTPNKTVEFQRELVERTGINPYEILLRIAGNDWRKLEFKSALDQNGEPVIPLRARLEAAREACVYYCPKPAAMTQVEINGNVIKTLETISREHAHQIIDQQIEDAQDDDSPDPTP